MRRTAVVFVILLSNATRAENGAALIDKARRYAAGECAAVYDQAHDRRGLVTALNKQLLPSVNAVLSAAQEREVLASMGSRNYFNALCIDGAVSGVRYCIAGKTHMGEGRDTCADRLTEAAIDASSLFACMLNSATKTLQDVCATTILRLPRKVDVVEWFRRPTPTFNGGTRRSMAVSHRRCKRDADCPKAQSCSFGNMSAAVGRCTPSDVRASD